MYVALHHVGHLHVLRRGIDAVTESTQSRTYATITRQTTAIGLHHDFKSFHLF